MILEAREIQESQQSHLINEDESVSVILFKMKTRNELQLFFISLLRENDDSLLNDKTSMKVLALAKFDRIQYLFLSWN